MPTCSGCRVAYLDGESHKCAARSTSLISLILSAVTGAIAGAVFGGFAVAIGYLSLIQGEQGPFIGTLVGGLAGAVFGAWIRDRIGRDW
jgi:outer membrane lipoprotein SlyB